MTSTISRSLIAFALAFFLSYCFGCSQFGWHWVSLRIPNLIVAWSSLMLIHYIMSRQNCTSCIFLLESIHFIVPPKLQKVRFLKTEKLLPWKKHNLWPFFSFCSIDIHQSNCNNLLQQLQICKNWECAVERLFL